MKSLLRPSFIATFSLCLLLIAGCKHARRNQEVNKPAFNPNYARFISAYTSGTLPRNGVIQIRLTDHVIPDAEIGKEVKKDVFSFEPNVKGKTSWVDARTLQFKPDELLDAGQVYNAKLDLRQMYDTISSDLRYFPFQFNTPPQYFSVEMQGMMPMEDEKVKWQRFAGTLVTNEYEKPENIEQCATISRHDSKLHIRWTHTEDGLRHRFVVDSLDRKKTSDSILVVLNGKAINYNYLHSAFYRIPALGEFYLTHAEARNDPEQYIELQYSDPLDPKQDLKGLIHCEKTRFKFTIESGTIKAFPEDKLTTDEKVTIEPGIRNILGYRTKTRDTQTLSFEDIHPQIKLVGNGVIIPRSNGIPFPFEAVNLNAVDVRITKIYEKNVLQFLQNSTLDGNVNDYSLEYVGKVIYEKRVPLDADTKLNLGKWNRHALDLSQLISLEPGAIYNVTLRYRKSYSLYNCPSTTKSKNEDQPNDLLTKDKKPSLWDYYENYNYGEGQDEPCNDNYYRRYDAQVTRNVLASDLGMLAKEGTDGSMLMAVTDLRTTNPLPNIPIDVYDLQKQKLLTINTDANGLASFRTDGEEPFVAVARMGEQRGYLRLRSNPLTLSRFDVSGQEYRKGVKGFIYGDRGVWRPGDSIYLTFILEDKMRALPINYPVIFEFYNPTGQLVQKTVRNQSLNGFYPFPTATDLNAPTGDYIAKINVGGVIFQKNIKVETIQPNRLKMDVKFAKDYIAKDDKTIGELSVKWLHGAIAKGLEAEVTAGLVKDESAFPAYKDYIFHNPLKQNPSENTTLFQGRLDDKGMASIPNRINVSGGASGPLMASIYGKITESGGNFSTDYFVTPYHPFDHYVGFRLPKGEGDEQVLLAGKDQKIDIVTIDKDGKPVNGKVDLVLYRIQRYWWYDYYDNENTFNAREYKDPIASQVINTVNGHGEWKINVGTEEYGRYYIQVSLRNGHSSGKFITIDNANWYTRGGDDNESGTSILQFNANKAKYKVGETAELDIPAGYNGRALVTMETGSKVLKAEWIKTQQKHTRYAFTVTPDMAPNIYISVTLIQPHAQTVNDLPIRLFGVIPVVVDDPKSHLQPVVTLPKTLMPEQTVNLMVKEQSGRAMTYTIAMVDEGLLDLTHFNTPDPWKHFNAKEALQVKTWDLFDMVLGNYTNHLKKFLSIGGDEEVKGGGNEGSRVQRFKPMVRFLGPFSIGPGKTAVHKIRIPRYIGSVRTMVVAAENNAYGSTELTTPVRAPLMVLGTLPRVLRPNEQVELPVSVFAMEDNVKDVTVSVKSSSILGLDGQNSRQIHFKEKGEQVVSFPYKVKSEIGIASVEITATSGKEKARYSIEMDVRAPNPMVSRNTEMMVGGQKEVSMDFTAFGIKGTNKGVLEVSSIPPLNLEDRLQYLIQYPHGCIEQTTSSVFPQLYVYQLLKLPDARKKEIEQNIKAGIRRLRLFQLPNGAMSYWPEYGYAEPSEWGTNYAGHFLIEAQSLGYNLPPNMLEKWKQYQKSRANSWTLPQHGNDAHRYFYGDYDEMTQAYRLYLLALAKSPELGAMNRLRESSKLGTSAKWLLAAAYYMSGQKGLASKLTASLPMDIPAYRELGYTYGSDLRDEAMIIDMLSLMNRQEDAFHQIRYVSDVLKSERWLSTQETAYCLMSLCKSGLKYSSGGFNIEYRINGGSWQPMQSAQPMMQIPIDLAKQPKGKIDIRSKASGLLYANLVLQGIPEAGKEIAENQKVNMTVTYLNKEGQPINPGAIEQGTDFIAEIKVDNPNEDIALDEMALTAVFPSGWQIYNPRMTGYQFKVSTSKPEYMDIRDDRVSYYFDLKNPKYDYYYGYYMDEGDEESDEDGNNASRPRSSNHLVFRVMLNASYAGTFYLPSIYMEAMYDKSIHASSTGRWVKVVKSQAGLVEK